MARTTEPMPEKVRAFLESLAGQRTYMEMRTAGLHNDQIDRCALSNACILEARQLLSPYQAGDKTMPDKIMTGMHLVSASRLKNSDSGNPRWVVIMTDADGDAFEANTASDASCSYDIQNYTHPRYERVAFTVRVGGYGQITHIDPETDPR